MLWKCPKCGREFSKKNQSHPCLSYSVESHFEGKPAIVIETFDYLLEKLREFGPIRIDSVKTAINLGAKTHFAMVYVQKGGLKLEFISDKIISDDRIIRHQKIYGNAYTHFVKLSKKEDADNRLISWLKRAHSLKE